MKKSQLDKLIKEEVIKELSVEGDIERLVNGIIEETKGILDYGDYENDEELIEILTYTYQAALRTLHKLSKPKPPMKDAYAKGGRADQDYSYRGPA